MEENEKLADLERRLDALDKRFDDLAERFGQRIDPYSSGRRFSHSNGRTFWGAIFLLIGFVWLANRMGWFVYDIPVAAVVLIAVGLYMILTTRQ